MGCDNHYTVVPDNDREDDDEEESNDEIIPNYGVLL